MIYFFESNKDLANRGGVVADGSPSWYDDVEHTSGMDIADYIDLSTDRSYGEDEYRDERDGSERLADRHGC